MPKLLLVALTATLLAACGSTTDQPKSAQSEPAKTAPAAQPEAAKPAESAKPTEAAKPAETAKPAEAAKPAETQPAAAQPAAAPAPAAADATKPTDATAAAAADAPKADDKVALPDVVHATIHVPEGDIHVDLFHKTAPLSVENFVKLTKQKFYDGLAFHRVEPGFVVQGGDPNTREGATGIPGTGGPGYTIPAEIGPSNPEKHLPGTLGMADAGLNTAGSQFYFTLAATPHLDGRYTVFGRVSSDKDLEVVKQIKKGDRFTVTLDDVK